MRIVATHWTQESQESVAQGQSRTLEGRTRDIRRTHRRSETSNHQRHVSLRLRGDRGALVSHAISLQGLVYCATRHSSKGDTHEQYLFQIHRPRSRAFDHQRDYGHTGYLFEIQSHPELSVIAFARKIVAYQWLT